MTLCSLSEGFSQLLVRVSVLVSTCVCVMELYGIVVYIEAHIVLTIFSSLYLNLNLNPNVNPNVAV